MISNNAIKTEKPNINFYYEDIINYLKNQTQYLNSQKIPKKSINKSYKTNTNTILK